MFSFAVWDESAQTLLCARDRFGEKPFYYARPSANSIVFASELKALVASGLIQPEVDRAAIAYYFKRHYVHPWKTIYKNVHVLPPGHSLVWNTSHHAQRRYWIPTSQTQRITLDDAAALLRDKLDAAVQSQLIADVEVGAFLSGGVDSTTIVALAAKHQTGLKTFCVNIGSSTGDAPYARMASVQYGTQHTELDVSDRCLDETLRRLACVYDEPLGDTSTVPTYLVAQEARAHVKVVLTGDGGDEMLGGYAWYRPLCWAERFDSPSYWRWITARLVSRVARTFDLASANRLEERNIGIGMSRRNRDVVQSHREQLSFCHNAQLSSLGLGPFVPDIDDWDSPMMHGKDLAGAMSFDVQNYLPGDILTKVDRASMAHGLELRAPFLDATLGQFCLSLPSSLRVTTAIDKRFLRAAFSETWPKPIRFRSKQGFGAPVRDWLARPTIRQLVDEVIDSRTAAIYGLLDYKALSNFYSSAGQLQKWAVLTLALWADRWLAPRRTAG